MLYAITLSGRRTGDLYSTREAAEAAAWDLAVTMGWSDVDVRPIRAR